MNQYTFDEFQADGLSDLTDLYGVGHTVAENLRASGFETADAVLDADVDELAEVELIGEASAKAILTDGRDGSSRGRNPEVIGQMQSVLQHATEAIPDREVIRRSDIGWSTHKEWLNKTKYPYTIYQKKWGAERDAAMVDTDCDGCGKTFKINSSFSRAKGGYARCEECRGSVTVACDNCSENKTIPLHRSQRYENHFCSEKCANEFKCKENSETLNYGQGWRKNRAKAIQRDGHQCRSCGMRRDEHYDEYGVDLHVHHVIPAREFEDAEKRNELANLVTLCWSCHSKYEGTQLKPSETSSESK